MSENHGKVPTKNIIWSWTPTQEQRNSCEKAEVISDIAEEYRIEKIPDKYPGGILVWGLYHGAWHPNPNERYVVAELLKRLGTMKE